MRLVGPSLADYIMDRLSTVLIKSIPPHLFFFNFFFTGQKYATVMHVLTAESSNYRLQLSLMFCT